MPSERLSLIDAVQRWCDRDLVQAIRDEECTFLEYELDRVQNIPQFTSRRARRQPTDRSWMIDADYTRLLALWRDLDGDFRRRIEDGEIFLLGVQLKPELRADAEPIPGVWAAGFEINYLTGTISVADRRYAGIQCSREPVASTKVSPDGTEGTGLLKISPEDVPKLADDTILMLLEEHHRRVMASPDATLFPPGKISFMPFVLRMMEARAEHGELLPELGSEARWLEAWIKRKAPTHQTPTAATIENSIRSSYRLLNPRSKATIQSGAN